MLRENTGGRIDSIRSDGVLGAGGVRYAFLGEARLRGAGQLLLGGLGGATRLRILLAFGHEARQRRAGKLLGRRLVLAGIGQCGAGEEKRGENKRDGLHLQISRWCMMRKPKSGSGPHDACSWPFGLAWSTTLGRCSARSLSV